MALHYDYTECDLKDVPNDVIETMIHVTMVIDVGEFTKKNVKDIFYRIKISEMFNGSPFIYSFENETKSILADQDLIKKFIGLKTNVRTISLRKWFSSKVKQYGVLNEKV
jgi:hypothetical protein